MKEWQTQLKNANEKLDPLGMRLTLNEDEEGFFALLVSGPRTKEVMTYAENYYEDELEDLISKAEAYARTKGERSTRPRPVRIAEAKTLAEIVYDITALVEQRLSALVEDSRERFSLIWNWALAFEKSWGERDEEDPLDGKEYMDAVETFAELAIGKLTGKKIPDGPRNDFTESGLSLRTFHALKRADIQTLAELCSFRRSEVMRMQGFGKRAMYELEILLEENHLQWDSAPKVPRLKHLYNL